MPNFKLFAATSLSVLLGACTGTGTSSSSKSSAINVASSSLPVTVTSSSSPKSSSLAAVSSSSLAPVVSSSSVPVASSSSVPAATGGVNTNTDLPVEMRISADGEILESGGFYTSKLYDESTVEKLYLEFSQADYKTQLTNNYASKKEIEAKLKYKTKEFASVGVRYRGNTSYQRAGNKKSFSIDLEWSVEGQDINGYNELKLNNAFEDESSMREVLYANLARKNIPAAKANFVNVYVNGENYGIYANVQKLEKDHVKEWFLEKDATRWRAEKPTSAGGGGTGGIFGAGTSSLNDLGEKGSAYENAYTLKSATIVDPWQDLADAAHNMGTGVMSNDAYINKLGQYLDVDAALWFVATENAFTDDDSYVNKGGMDYYVYFDIATNRIVPIEYDGNSAMETKLATTWTPFYNVTNKSFPLLNILLNIPQLRQRYLAHYRVVMEESLNPDIAKAKIEAYDKLINAGVAANDAVRIYTYAQYTSGVTELKNFFTSRTNYLKSNSEINQEGLTISNVNDSVNGQISVRPTDAQAVVVTAQVAGSKGVKSVNLYYGTGLMGGFTKLSMALANGKYSATIPKQVKGAFVRYYIEALANDTAVTASYSPVGAEHDVYIYQVISAETSTSAVVINEIMPANKTVAIDEEGEYGDWIELYNTSNQDMSLNGYYLTDEETQLDRWAFPTGTVIKAKSTLIVWADDKNDLTTGLHANFKLSAAGENLYLVAPNKSFADQVTFTNADDDKSFARTPNGTGGFIWTATPSFNKTN